jgi:hypothetical protein
MTLAVCVPPDPRPLDRLFAADLRRAALVAATADAVRAARAEGRAVLGDCGTAGFDAPATAARLRARGVEVALIVGGPFDVAACAVLAEACGAEAIVARVVATGFDVRDALAAAMLDAPRGAVPAAFDDPSPFVDAPDVVRVAFRPDDPVDGLVAAVRAAAATRGADRVRLAFEPSPAAAAHVDALRAWTLLAGLEPPAARARLAAVVADALPGARYAFEKACALADLGVDPFVAAYARRNLADRNAELLQVVAP